MSAMDPSIEKKSYNVRYHPSAEDQSLPMTEQASAGDTNIRIQSEDNLELEMQLSW